MIIEIVKPILLLLLGFILLIKGADFFVEGSASLARRYHIPTLIIGLTIVAMGTSLPELSVSVVASLEGNNSMSVSNVLGSNIFNLLVVLGFSACMQPIVVSKDVLRRDFPLSMLFTGFILLCGTLFSSLTRPIGIILITTFTLYLVNINMTAIKARRIRKELYDASDKSALSDDSLDEGTAHMVYSLGRCIVYIVGGIIAIKFGGDFVVSNASLLASFMGISETLIGLTIVSVGTSLPELVTSIVAAKKGEVEMAIGNAVGSNLFNLLLILGTASVVSPIPFITENTIDTAALLVVSLITFIFCYRRTDLNKKEGLTMLALYAAYTVYIILR